MSTALFQHLLVKPLACTSLCRIVIGPSHNTDDNFMFAVYAFSALWTFAKLSGVHGICFEIKRRTFEMDASASPSGVLVSITP